jgi:hypothetical protein
VRLLHLANHGAKNIGGAPLVLGLARVLREGFRFDLLLTLLERIAKPVVF